MENGEETGPVMQSKGSMSNRNNALHHDGDGVASGMDHASNSAREPEQVNNNNTAVVYNPTTATSSTTGTTEEAPPSSPLTIIVARFRSADVLLGRGTGPANHKGNVYFRDLVERAKRSYVETPSRKVKSRLVRDIVNGVKAKGGRFLRKLSPTVLAEDDDPEEGSTSSTTGSTRIPTAAPADYLPPTTSFPITIVDESGEQDEDALYAVVSDCVAFEKTKQAIRYVHYKKEPQQEHYRVVEVPSGEDIGGTAANDNTSMMSGTTSERGNDGVKLISPFTTTGSNRKRVNDGMDTYKSREQVRIETLLKHSTTITMMEDEKGQVMNETGEKWWGGGAAATTATTVAAASQMKKKRSTGIETGSFDEERQAKFNLLTAHIGSTASSSNRSRDIGEGNNTTILAALLSGTPRGGTSLGLPSMQQEQYRNSNLLGLSPPTLSSFFSTTLPYTRQEELEQEEEEEEEKWKRRQILSLLSAGGDLQQLVTDSLLRQLKKAPPPPLSSLAPYPPFLSNYSDNFERLLAGSGASTSTAATNSELIRRSVLLQQERGMSGLLDHHFIGGILPSPTTSVAPALSPPSFLLTALLQQQKHQRQQLFPARANSRTRDDDYLPFTSAQLHELLGARRQVLPPATLTAAYAFGGGAVDGRIHSTSVASYGSWNGEEDARKTTERNNTNEYPRSESKRQPLKGEQHHHQHQDNHQPRL